MGPTRVGRKATLHTDLNWKEIGEEKTEVKVKLHLIKLKNLV